MKLLLLSDLHREQMRYVGLDDPLKFDLAGVDAVCLAGDIDVSIKRSFEWIARTFGGLPVFYTFGNHEFEGRNWNQVFEQARELEAAHPNIRVMENREVTFEGVRFLGCTLWTNFLLMGRLRRERSMRQARTGMVDFQGAILIDRRKAGIMGQGERESGIFRPEDSVRLHRRSVTWLKKRLSTPFDGATVVITHHAPSARSVPPVWIDDDITPAYASNLDDLAEKVTLWHHGHMHSVSDYVAGSARIICNPLGSPRSAWGYAENGFVSQRIVAV